VSTIEPTIVQCKACGADTPSPQSLPTWLVRCDSCADEEHARVLAELDAQRVAADAKRAAQQLARRRQESGVPRLLRGRTLDDLDEDGRHQALAAARRIADGHHGPLSLLGPVGTGKTTIAAAVTGELLHTRDVRWVSVPALIAGLDARFGSDDREDALAVLRGTRALVLDDLDKARANEQIAMHLFTAVDQRVQNAAPLIVTANLTLTQLAKRWPQPHGQALASRLAGGIVVHVDGRDRRLDRKAA